MSGLVSLLMSSDETRESTAVGLRERRIDVTITDSIAGLLDLPATPDVAVVESTFCHEGQERLWADLRDGGLAGLIVLGAPGGGPDAADVLRAGADDFMSYPVSPAELIARVRALLRRLREYCVASSVVMDFGDVIMHCDRHEVMVRGEQVSLTPKEFELLRELARGAGELVQREELLERVWGFDESVSSRTLDVHVGRLRKKIERDPSSPRLIVTVPRAGYRVAA